MGPYCKFCGRRCFVPFPKDAPPEILAAYRPGVSIVATCAEGQQFEKEATGYCLADIEAAIKEKRAHA
jgi:hypothetical protein